MAHLMSVAAFVLEHGGGEDAAISGLLQDAVEDSSDGTQMKQRIREEFGDRVAETVMGCSDAVAVPGQPKPPWRARKAAYLDRLAGEDDPDILLVSACDNCTTRGQSSPICAPSGRSCGTASPRPTRPRSCGTTSPWHLATRAGSLPHCLMS